MSECRPSAAVDAKYLPLAPTPNAGGAAVELLRMWGAGRDEPIGRTISGGGMIDACSGTQL